MVKRNIPEVDSSRLILYARLYHLNNRLELPFSAELIDPPIRDVMTTINLSIPCVDRVINSCAGEGDKEDSLVHYFPDLIWGPPMEATAWST